jgi:hypothetical protein
MSPVAGDVFQAAFLPDLAALLEQNIVQACGDLNSVKVLGKYRPSISSLPASLLV